MFFLTHHVFYAAFRHFFLPNRLMWFSTLLLLLLLFNQTSLVQTGDKDIQSGTLLAKKQQQLLTTTTKKFKLACQSNINTFDLIRFKSNQYWLNLFMECWISFFFSMIYSNHFWLFHLNIGDDDDDVENWNFFNFFSAEKNCHKCNNGFPSVFFFVLYPNNLIQIYFNTWRMCCVFLFDFFFFANINETIRKKRIFFLILSNYNNYTHTTFSRTIGTCTALDPLIGKSKNKSKKKSYVFSFVEWKMYFFSWNPFNVYTHTHTP